MLSMLRHSGSQPRIEEGASRHARRGKNARRIAAVQSEEVRSIFNDNRQHTREFAKQ